MENLFSALLRLVFVATIVAGTSVSFANESPKEVQAPFGLKWGAKKSDFSNLFDCETNRTFISCRTNSVPKGLSNTEFYSFIFDNEEGLVKITHYGKNIIGDPYGTEAKDRFNKLKSALSGKYPDAKKKDFIWMHLKLYKESDEFYECLRYSGCGSYAFAISPEGGGIFIEVYGMRRGEGYIKLIYESAKWSDVIDRFKASKDADDADAL